LLANAGLGGVFRAAISVDELKCYKPAPAVYQLAVDRLGLPKERIGFVSSNCWDACGAKSFGFRTYWINRTGAPLDALDVTPDHTIARLTDLAALIA
jgi:2-haloacid dehalogenase